MTTQLILGLLPNVAYLATQQLLSGIETSTTFKLMPHAGPTSVFESLMLRSQALLTVTFEDSQNTSNASFGGQLQRALPDLLIKNPQVAVCALIPSVGTPVVAARNEARSTYPRDLTITPLFTALSPRKSVHISQDNSGSITEVGIACTPDLRLSEARALFDAMAQLGFSPLFSPNNSYYTVSFENVGVSRGTLFAPLIFKTGIEPQKRDIAKAAQEIGVAIDSFSSVQASYLYMGAQQPSSRAIKTATPKAS